MTLTIEATPITGYIPLIVAFSHSGATITPVSASWDFGDGETSAETNPEHRYTSAGSYLVTLTLTDASNNTETATITITALEPIPPNVSITAVNPGYAPATVAFIGTVEDGHPTDYVRTWSFGDGETSTEENPEHRYTSAGSYLVTLTVVSNAGNTTTSASITIVLAEPTYPTPSLKTQQTGQFDVSVINATEYINITPQRVIWNFGDGTPNIVAEDPAGMAAQTHTYAVTGIYIVTATLEYSTGYQQLPQISAVLYYLNAMPDGIILNGQYKRRK